MAEFNERHAFYRAHRISIYRDGGAWTAEITGRHLDGVGLAGNLFDWEAHEEAVKRIDAAWAQFLGAR